MSETREIWVSDEPADAALKARRTLEKLGELVHVEPGISLTGRIAFGVQAATVKITWRPEEAAANTKSLTGGGAATIAKGAPALLGTMLTVEATSEQSPAAASSAIERFEEAYFHYGDPTYKPDRLGVMPLTIVAIFVVLILAGVMAWRNPAIRKHLPNLPGHSSVQVPSPSPPAGDPSPDPNSDQSH